MNGPKLMATTSASGKGTVLIVDDEIFNLDLLDLILKGAEYNSVRARDGIEAMEKLAEFGRFDVILLDWMMPRMDGMQLLRMLKSEPHYYEIPVIMQTSIDNTQKVKEAMDAGAYSYLVKPYIEEAIVKIVEAAQHYTQRKSQW